MRRPNIGHVLSALIVVGVVPIQAAAQDGYFFKPPQATLAFRVGGSVLNAHGPIFNFITEQLTVDRSDFRAVSVGGDLGVRLTPQLDLLLSGSYASSSTRSEFRDWLDLDDQAIEQETELWTAPLTASLKYYISPRGRSLGKFAWVPNQLLPYFGAGGGVMFYKLTQNGDFVDYQTLEVFPASLKSNGSTAMVQVMAGADWWLHSRVGLTLDGRYAWASAEVSPDFSDVANTINLRGFQVTTGLAVRF